MIILFEWSVARIHENRAGDCQPAKIVAHLLAIHASRVWQTKENDRNVSQLALRRDNVHNHHDAFWKPYLA